MITYKVKNLDFISSDTHYYEISHQDILIIDQYLMAPVAVHYIQSNIWDEIQENDANTIIFNPHQDFPLNSSVLQLLAENRTISNNENHIQYTFSTHNKIDSGLRDSGGSQMEIWLEFEKDTDFSALIIPVHDDIFSYDNLTDIKLPISDSWGFDSSCYIGKDYLVGINQFSEINEMIIEVWDLISHHWKISGNITAHRLHFESELMQHFFWDSETTELDGFSSTLILAYITLQFAILYIMNKIIQNHKTDFSLYYQRGYSIRKNKIRLWKKIIFYPLLIISITEGILLQIILYFTVSQSQTIFQINFLFISWFLIQFISSSYLSLRNFRQFEALSSGMSVEKENVSFSKLLKIVIGILLVVCILSFFIGLWSIGDYPLFFMLTPIIGILVIGLLLNNLINNKIRISSHLFSKILLQRFDRYKALIMLVIVMMIVFQLLIIPMTPVSTPDSLISDNINFSVRINNIQNGGIVNYDYSKIDGVKSYIPRLELSARILDIQSTDGINVFVMNFSQIELNFNNFTDAKFIMDNIGNIMISQDLTHYIETGLNTIVLGDYQITIDNPTIMPASNDFLPAYRSVILSTSLFQNLGFNLSAMLKSLDSMSIFTILMQIDEEYSAQAIGSATAEAIRVPEHHLRFPDFVGTSPYHNNVRQISMVLIIAIMMIFETLLLIILLKDAEFSTLSRLVLTRCGKTKEIKNIQSKTNLIILLLEYFVYLLSLVSIFTIDIFTYSLSFLFQDILLATLYIPALITIPHIVAEIFIVKRMAR